MKQKNLPLKITGIAFVYAFALILLVPMFFIIMTAFKPEAQVIADPFGLPSPARFANFTDALIQGNMLRDALNSVIVTVSTLLLALVNSIWVTFCIKKLTAHLVGTILYTIIIITMFIPSGAGMVTMLLMYERLHLYNSLLGVILGMGFGGTAFNLFLMLGFMRAIPKELEEASFIDGCGPYRSLIYITVPLMKPILVSIGIFTLVSSWNALMPSLLLLRSPNLWTIPIGLMQFRTPYTVQYSLIFAGILMTGVPLVVIYLFFQKYFVEALAGSVKG